MRPRKKNDRLNLLLQSRRDSNYEFAFQILTGIYTTPGITGAV